MMTVISEEVHVIVDVGSSDSCFLWESMVYYAARGCNVLWSYEAYMKCISIMISWCAHKT